MPCPHTAAQAKGQQYTNMRAAQWGQYFRSTHIVTVDVIFSKTQNHVIFKVSNTNSNELYSRFSPYRAVNLLSLGYKNRFDNSVYINKASDVRIT